MSQMMLKAVPIVTKGAENKDSLDGWVLRMPVGAQICDITCDARGTVGAFVLQTPNAVLVDHPLLIIQVNDAYTPMLGRSVGECLKVLMIPGLGMTGIFQDLPWPQKALNS